MVDRSGKDCIIIMCYEKAMSESTNKQHTKWALFILMVNISGVN